MQYTSQNARFSRCKNYRYTLKRSWDEGAGKVLFVGLNPSTADHRKDDPTIRRCVGFAHSWGFAAMEIANLFAYRATYPRDLKMASDPIGPRNGFWLLKAMRDSDLVVACWGTDGNFRGAADRFLRRHENLHCIKWNSSQTPAHPLYLKKDLVPIPIPSYPALDESRTQSKSKFCHRAQL